jgi:hypothetical protein
MTRLCAGKQAERDPAAIAGLSEQALVKDAVGESGLRVESGLAHAGRQA